MENNLANAIEQMRAGGEAGLNYVYSKTYNYVYLRARSILKKEADIQTLVKDVYVQVFDKASEIQEEKLYAWLGKCVYTLGSSRFRKKKAREAGILEYEQNELSSRKSNPSEAATEIIHESLEQLPELYQATTFAFYYDHMPVRTIAEVMDVEEEVILNRLNYVRKYILKAMEIYQEEKKEKVFFSVETMCVALHKWATNNCLGMTGAQMIYAAICKEKSLQAEPVGLGGDEFAGVNHTYMQHKLEDLSLLEEQFALYGEKKSTVEPKKIGKIVGVIALVFAIIIGIVFAAKNMDKVKETPKDENPTVENPVGDSAVVDDMTDELPDEIPDEKPEVIQDETPETSSVSNGDYIFPESNTRLLTADEVASKTKEELRLARNEIFARHGAIFGVDDLDEYFKSKSWYTPKISISDYYDQVEMSMIEEQNINLILEYESKM